MNSRLIIGVLVAAVLGLMPASALATDANGNHATYRWIIGATTPGDKAIAPDGSTITMTGSGMLSAGPGNTATGGGSFSMSNGSLGTWHATDVQGFVSYGSPPPGFPVPGAIGGETKLDVTLSNGASGVLTIICELGSPPAGKMEGITVILNNGGNFTQQDGGNNIFIAS